MSWMQQPKKHTPLEHWRYSTICPECEQIVIVAYFGYPPDYRLLPHMLSEKDGYCVGSKRCVKSSNDVEEGTDG